MKWRLEMKYIIVLGDGMADYPVEELGNRTPLQAAHKSNMDEMARNGEVGLVQTTPEGMPPGSDTTNLAIMGYDPRRYYSGRSPLEAASIGIPLKDNDVTFRMNLVTLSDEPEYEKKTMVDYSSDEITTEEAAELVKFLSQHLDTESMKLYAGISYRHCLVWEDGATGLDLTPPHDILEQGIGSYLPKGEGSGILYRMQVKSYELLRSHPVNLDRVRRGLRPANSAWFWGEGKKPLLTPLFDRYGKKSAVISAVNLIKGIGICAGMTSIDVEGATGTIHTNFKGKAQAAIDALENGYDYVYIHIEAPDECGHRHEIENKVKSIELIDAQIITPIRERFRQTGQPYRMLVLPDHPTPLRLRTHTRDAVPYLLYSSTHSLYNGAALYSEEEAKKTGKFIEAGFLMLDKLFEE